MKPLPAPQLTPPEVPASPSAESSPGKPPVVEAQVPEAQVPEAQVPPSSLSHPPPRVDYMRPFRKNWVQIGLVFGVFVLFVLTATGPFQVILDVADVPISFPVVARSNEFILFCVIGVALSLCLPVLNPIQASALTFLSMVPVLYVGYANIGGTHPLLPMEYSLLTILMLFVVNVLVSYFTETTRKQQLVQAFGMYVPPVLARKVSQDPAQFTLRGESREMSIMFCDVHNFSTISEQLEPGELTELLNTLFTPLSEILYRHNGMIDKYIGDAIMAFWGAPLTDPHHASNAVAAAFEMQDAIQELQSTFKERGWPEITVGIGINTGVVSVGNMGSKYRVQYTVLGDAVNLGARLQELTRVFKARIIVGEGTRRSAPMVVFRELGIVQVKGKNELARIYEPSNPGSDPESTMVANMRRHNEALRCYYDRDWDVAESLFRMLRDEAEDEPLYEYYLGRIAEFRDNPPPPEWQGEIRFTVG